MEFLRGFRQGFVEGVGPFQWEEEVKRSPAFERGENEGIPAAGQLLFLRTLTSMRRSTAFCSGPWSHVVSHDSPLQERKVLESFQVFAGHLQARRLREYMPKTMNVEFVGVPVCILMSMTITCRTIPVRRAADARVQRRYLVRGAAGWRQRFLNRHTRGRETRHGPGGGSSW